LMIAKLKSHISWSMYNFNFKLLNILDALTRYNVHSKSAKNPNKALRFNTFSIRNLVLHFIFKQLIDFRN
jgi:hypothetical protein